MTTTVKKIPDWVRADNAVVQRDIFGRWKFVPLEKRTSLWRRLLQWWTMWVRRWIDEH